MRPLLTAVPLSKTIPSTDNPYLRATAQQISLVVQYLFMAMLIKHILLVVLVLNTAASAQAQGFFKNPVKELKKGGKNFGRVLDKAVKDAGKTVGVALHDIGKATGKAAENARKAIEKGLVDASVAAGKAKKI